MRSGYDQGDPGQRYLELLAGCLTRSLFIDEHHNEPRLGGWRRLVRDAVNRVERNLDDMFARQTSRSRS